MTIGPQIHVWDQDQDCSVFKESHILDLAFDRCRRLGQLSYYSVSVIIQMMIWYWFVIVDNTHWYLGMLQKPKFWESVFWLCTLYTLYVLIVYDTNYHVMIRRELSYPVLMHLVHVLFIPRSLFVPCLLATCFVQGRFTLYLIATYFI